MGLLDSLSALFSPTGQPGINPLLLMSVAGQNQQRQTASPLLAYGLPGEGGLLGMPPAKADDDSSDDGDDKSEAAGKGADSADANAKAAAEPSTEAPEGNGSRLADSNATISDFLQQYAGPSTRPKFNIGDMLGLVGATMSQASGASPNAIALQEQMMQQRSQAAQAQRQRMALWALAQKTGLSPTQMLLFAADPQKWAETYGHRVNDYHQAEGGHTSYWGDPSIDGAQETAPILDFDDGEGRLETYINGQGKLTDLGGVGESPQQQTKDAEDDAKDAAKQRHDTAQENYWTALGQAALTRAAKYKTGGKGAAVRFQELP